MERFGRQPHERAAEVSRAECDPKQAADAMPKFSEASETHAPILTPAVHGDPRGLAAGRGDGFAQSQS